MFVFFIGVTFITVFVCLFFVGETFIIVFVINFCLLLEKLLSLFLFVCLILEKHLSLFLFVCFLLGKHLSLWQFDIRSRCGSSAERMSNLLSSTRPSDTLASSSGLTLTRSLWWTEHEQVSYRCSLPCSMFNVQWE